MNIQGVNIPVRVRFTRGPQGPMAQIERDNIKLRLVPNRHGKFQPKAGETWKVQYEHTIQEEPGYALVIVNCEPEPTDLSVFVTNKPKQRRTPKRERPQTGHFVGEERDGAKKTEFDNVLPHVTRAMREAAAQQARLARRPAPARGTVASGVGSKGAASRSKNGKK